MDRQEVRKVAQLARLKISDAEVDQFTSELSRVLEYMSLLDEVDTEGVEPMVHAIELSNAFRNDVVAESVSRDDALRNAPATDGQYFLVPDILQKDQS